MAGRVGRVVTGRAGLERSMGDGGSRQQPQQAEGTPSAREDMPLTDSTFQDTMQWGP
jgi:hypothetical protein